jgi:hypothetical protein
MYCNFYQSNLPLSKSTAYACVWMTAVVGVFDAMGVIDETGNVSSDPVGAFILVLCQNGALDILRNQMHFLYLPL